MLAQTLISAITAVALWSLYVKAVLPAIALTLSLGLLERHIQRHTRARRRLPR